MHYTAVILLNVENYNIDMMFTVSRCLLRRKQSVKGVIDRIAN